MDSHHKGQWRVALMFSLICAWTNGWPNNLAHYDVALMCLHLPATLTIELKKYIVWVFNPHNIFGVKCLVITKYSVIVISDVYQLAKHLRFTLSSVLFQHDSRAQSSNLLISLHLNYPIVHPKVNASCWYRDQQTVGRGSVSRCPEKWDATICMWHALHPQTEWSHIASLEAIQPIV